MSSNRHVVVVGQGYVGLPVARAAVNAGHTVIGYDTDPDKVEQIRRGNSPIDDVTDRDLRAMLDTDRYTATSSAALLAGFDVAVVTVPTPLREGRPDLTSVVAAADAVGHRLRPGALVVLESTVAPGTTGGVFTEALEAASGLTAGDGAGQFLVAFSPERIDPGNQTWTVETTPKLVGGASAAATDAAAAFYGSMCERVVPVARAEVAELAKLLENTYRHVNCALANELARHAYALGVDIWQVIEAAETKPYGFQPFYPGPGVGGHCLPIDPVYLADGIERGTGRPFRFVDLAMQINAAQPAYVVDRITALLSSRRTAVHGATILVLGVTYKADSSDLRESPALEVVERLAQLGADLHICDPCAPVIALEEVARRHEAIVLDVDKAAAFVAVSDLVIVLTAHTDVGYDQVVQAAPLVFDTRGAFETASNIVKL
jgi:UDP-N-acetyl-D-glucosamine dehydrogenase